MHEKSALFSRLLEGKKPFKNPPPINFSYPDYDIIENPNPRELSMISVDKITSLIEEKSKVIDYKHVFINQSAWKVIKVISDNVIHITHPRWEAEGFIWELYLKEINAEESIITIIPHHNPKLKKITTLDDLIKESLFQTLEHFYAIKLVKDEKEYQTYEKLMTDRYAVLGGVMAKQKVELGKSLMQERIEKGLSDYPTENEIQAYAENQIKENYLKEFFVKDGNLYKNAVMIKRIAPSVLTDEHYMKIS